ncbi:MAG: 4-diphosphocytidyl-2-C-methyl-D-erythritol kinase [Cyclobacteriaceae bacterium]|jgi:4-diphosphocytidyl-2-C-methyl-D-erythritol kinase
MSRKEKFSFLLQFLPFPSMLCFPNAKINLGLNIVSKRADGFHNIETCFYPIPWCDALEIIPAEKLEFTATGLEIPGNKASNLCLKAYHLVKADYDIAPVHIYLHKVIPMGAGLGGGSSDGAFMLKLLNDHFELKINHHTLEDMAGKLGSDCPFFIQNKPLMARGTGTDFSDINISLQGKYIALTHPGIHVSTQEAYAGVNPQIPAKSIKTIIAQSIDPWKDELVNDFEANVFANYPQIGHLKAQFYKDGAVYAAMSGSGSCVFGIFEKEPNRANYDAVFVLW